MPSYVSSRSVAKSDPVPSADTAYAELMLKVEAYRDAHPELSVAHLAAWRHPSPRQRTSTVAQISAPTP
jgi:hypothetical protein